MNDLLDSLKNQASYTILNDIVKQGYARRTKGTERAKTIPQLVKSGIVESVAPSDYMLRFLRFENEQSKQNFIDEHYFLTITENGKLIFELLKWQKESIKEEQARARKVNSEERKRIALGLLKIIDIDLDEFINFED